MFRLTPHGSGYQEADLYSFSGYDGGWPYGTLIVDNSGALYGTASNFANGFGDVFKLTPKGSSYVETVLYAFQSDHDGGYPLAGLIEGKGGTLYGTTSGLGGDGCYTCGTVFKLTPQGSTYSERVLHTFGGSAVDGAYPASTLNKDRAGNLYGTTEEGGAFATGAFFRVKP